MSAVIIVVLYIGTILTCYIYYGQWLSGLADSAGDLPSKVEAVRIIAAVGTPAIIVNVIVQTVKFVAFLVLL